MKKILFLSVMNGSAWGGSEELWYQAALWTARHGYPVAVCCFDGEGKSNRLEKLAQAGCSLFLLPGKVETKKQMLLGKIKLNKAIAEVPFEEYDKVIVSQGGWKDVTHGPFKKLYRRLKEYVLIYHNYNIHEKFSLHKFSLLQKWAGKSEKNLGDTPKIFQALEEAYSLHIPRQEKLFNPLTFATPEKATAYPETLNGKYILAVFSALDIERKAQDVLIRALSGEAWRHRNWELHLYGEGKDKELLQQLIQELQLQSSIFLYGNASDYREAIRQSHLVLQITHMDAMPITVMDSLAMARPVVVSNVGDMPFWIKENVNGWVTNAVTPEAIQQTLEQAWQKRDRWSAMGEESFRIFRQDFPSNPVQFFLQQTGIIH
ncbi:MAG: glycosyltransferase family 4 protein [Bacteroidota bacterium]|nr:glycosyltransferase family 4 protein [Bacteroidota bacterium]